VRPPRKTRGECCPQTHPYVRRRRTDTQPDDRRYGKHAVGFVRSRPASHMAGRVFVDDHDCAPRSSGHASRCLRLGARVNLPSSRWSVRSRGDTGYTQPRAASEVARFGEGLVTPIVPAVFVSDGCLGEFLAGRVVQAGNVDGVELATQFFHVSAAEGFHSAAAAEEVMYGPSAEPVVRQSIFSLQ
jgi:hypothetical protein